MTPEQIIADARRTIKIVEEAEDAKLFEVFSILDFATHKPHSCRHPRKLTPAEKAQNKALHQIKIQVLSITNNRQSFRRFEVNQDISF